MTWFQLWTARLLSPRDQPTLQEQVGSTPSVRDCCAGASIFANILEIGPGSGLGVGYQIIKIFKNINGKIISNADKPFVNAADA